MKTGVSCSLRGLQGLEELFFGTFLSQFCILHTIRSLYVSIT